jgi:hypothetical protein
MNNVYFYIHNIAIPFRNVLSSKHINRKKQYLLFWLVMSSHNSFFFEVVMVDDTKQYDLLSV